MVTNMHVKKTCLVTVLSCSPDTIQKSRALIIPSNSMNMDAQISIYMMFHKSQNDLYM